MIDVFNSRSFNRCRWLWISLFKGQDGIGLNHDLFSKCTFFKCIRQSEVFICDLSTSTTSISINTVAINRWTRAKANSNVTLEA